MEDGPLGGRGKWSDPRVPKRGWTCESIDDLGDVLQTCEMCEAQDIRYVHAMSHPRYPGILECGCVCSGHMEEDVPAARAREAAVRNRAARWRNWPKLKRWYRSRSGNLTIEKDGCRVTVYVERGAYKISAGPIGVGPRFGRRVFETERAAVLASFDAFMWAKER
ncbi:hypothetical protein MKK68_02320 [Methylobacterium sp. E-016]|uniref:hypothetical protein n=1 Tax=Methylobacterium sp. E-016 TaxID=2836556 RepID=UPI001FB9AB81|nr:hypothetical protein [Methylobacterium sp. E-016]MCJ2074495.1 hypothetical protein [Methylobacterium sp. E-016]